MRFAIDTASFSAFYLHGGLWLLAGETRVRVKVWVFRLRIRGSG